MVASRSIRGALGVPRLPPAYKIPGTVLRGGDRLLASEELHPLDHGGSMLSLEPESCQLHRMEQDDRHGQYPEDFHQNAVIIRHELFLGLPQEAVELVQPRSTPLDTWIIKRLLQ